MPKLQSKLLARYPFPHSAVMNGELVFRLVDTYGLPLELVILKVQASKLFIDWVTFAGVAVASGWGAGKIDECRRLANSYYTERWIEETWRARKRNEYCV